MEKALSFIKERQGDSNAVSASNVYDAKHLLGNNGLEAGDPTWPFWILDFGFWIIRSRLKAGLKTIQNPKSKIQNGIHGDAIVRDSHPASMSLRNALFL